jgi:hypothetical protein
MSLPRNLFNQTLYSRVRDIWFSGLNSQASVPPENLMKRWFPQDEKTRDAFDNECKKGLEEALIAIGPNSGHSVESLKKSLVEEVKVGHVIPYYSLVNMLLELIRYY